MSLLNRINPYVLAFGSVLIWGASTAVSKLLLVDLSPVGLLFYISLFATFSFLIIIWASNKWSLLLQTTLHDLKTHFLLSVLGVFLYLLLLIYAIDLLPVQEATLVHYLWPVLIVLLAVVILRESLNVQKVIGILLGFAGALIVITQGNVWGLRFDNLLGVGLALGAAFCYAGFSVLSKKYAYDPVISAFFAYGISFVLSFLTILIQPIPLLPLSSLPGLIWIGVIASAFGYLFWLEALSRGDASKLSNIMLLIPLLSLVYIHFLIGEIIQPASMIGLVLIMAGIGIQSARKKN